MHSGRWGLSRETIGLLDLRHNHFSGQIFFCFIPLPIPQCIQKSSNAISCIVRDNLKNKKITNITGTETQNKNKTKKP